TTHDSKRWRSKHTQTTPPVAASDRSGGDGLQQGVWGRMSWSEELMASLDARASVLRTARGEVQLAREGDGHPVLVVHGGPGGFDQALAYSRHLRDGGCELLAPSRPGYLRTPLQSGRSPEAQADLYAAALDTLGIKRAAILGHSSGGPSAVHFAARHPERTQALFLDAAILLPFTPPIGALRRATYESSVLVWFAYWLSRRWPELMARLMVSGVSDGLSRAQRRAAADWMTADQARLQSLQAQWASSAPRRYRAPGQSNDEVNEADLSPLPFADIRAPTLIAHGTNEAIVPVGHATNAADNVADAQLRRVQEGHHILSASRSYGLVAQRQLELAKGS
ncbi:MAG: alpha/beta fold hydrolase, partial [Gaiellaceae bacterium]